MVERTRKRKRSDLQVGVGVKVMCARLSSFGRCACLSLLLLFLVSCSGRSGDFAFLPSITGVEPDLDLVVPGSRLEVRGTGFLLQPTGQTRVVIDGSIIGVKVLFAVEVQPETSNLLYFDFTPEVVAQFASGTGQFQGSLQIEIVLSTGHVERSAPVQVGFYMSPEIVPTANGIPPLTAYPGSRLNVVGDNFLYPAEGQTLAIVTGTLTRQDGTLRHLQELPLPFDVTDRKRATLRLAPEAIGIRPGSFSGTFTLRNESYLGASMQSNVERPIDFLYQGPVISGLNPSYVRRGQILFVDGLGLVDQDPELGVGSLVLLDGLFHRSTGEIEDFTGPNSVVLFPEVVHEHTGLDIVLRAFVGEDGMLSGFGIHSGVFSGVATPWVVAGSESLFGESASIELEVLPPRQVVFIKILPGFDDALDRFGLYAVKDLVLERVIEVVHRDYEGVNIEFRIDRPEDYVEYTVVEVGGADPNGANLLGLDNTEGKDVGNLRFNDVIGGYNALSEAEGYYAYGGVFVESFFQFSQNHPLSEPSMANARFDDVFGMVSPELGGAPATFDDLDPALERFEVGEARRVLGNLIGNTLSHEVGHSLGLANIPGRFHNEGDNPGWIMDSGLFRPFEERAELDGMGPASFSPVNKAYLLEILPPDFL